MLTSVTRQCIITVSTCSSSIRREFTALRVPWWHITYCTNEVKKFLLATVKPGLEIMGINPLVYRVRIHITICPHLLQDMTGSLVAIHSTYIITHWLQYSSPEIKPIKQTKTSRLPYYPYHTYPLVISIHINHSLTPLFPSSQSIKRFVQPKATSIHPSLPHSRMLYPKTDQPLVNLPDKDFRVLVYT